MLKRKKKEKCSIVEVVEQLELEYKIILTIGK